VAGLAGLVGGLALGLCIVDLDEAAPDPGLSANLTIDESFEAPQWEVKPD